MRKVTRILVGAILLVHVLAVVLLPSVTVVALQRGVNEDDYFTYGKIKTWIDPPNMELLPQWKSFQNLTMINFTIVRNPVNPSLIEVSFRQNIAFSNGTPTKTLDGAMDLLTGLGQGYVFFVLAGLKTGEKVYPESVDFNWTLTETRVDPYWGGREICVLNQTAIWNKTTTLFYQSEIFYWDKLTGALLLLRGTSGAYEPYTRPIEGGVRLELVATNRFPIEHPGGLGDLWPVYVVVGGVLVGALVVVVVRASSAGSSKKKWKRIKE